MRKVEVNIDIAVSPETVIRAFTDAGMLQGWWGVERTFSELREGGTYLVAWQVTGHGFRYVTTGVIRRYDPESVLEIGNLTYLNPEKPILGGMRLVVTAKPGPAGSAVYLCQDGYPAQGHDEDWDWYYQAVLEAWPRVVQALKAYLEKD